MTWKDTLVMKQNVYEEAQNMHSMHGFGNLHTQASTQVYEQMYDNIEGQRMRDCEKESRGKGKYTRGMLDQQKNLHIYQRFFFVQNTTIYPWPTFESMGCEEKPAQFPKKNPCSRNNDCARSYLTMPANIEMAGKQGSQHSHHHKAEGTP